MGDKRLWPFYGEFDNAMNKLVFGKRKVCDSPGDKPPLGKTAKKKNVGSPRSGSPRSGSDGSGQASPLSSTVEGSDGPLTDLDRTFTGVSLDSESLSPEKRHPFDVAPSSLSRFVFPLPLAA